MSTAEKHIEIENILNDMGLHSLAECMYMVDDRYLNAIALMINKGRDQGVFDSVIKHCVSQDMASLVSGYIETPLYCAQYVTGGVEQSQVAAHVCDKCGNNSQVLVKVSIPNIDLQQLCVDCKKTIEMYAGVVGIL